MKHWLAALTLCLSFAAQATDTNWKLETICFYEVESTPKEVRALISNSIDDVFHVTKDSEERGIHLFAQLRHAVTDCRNEAVAPTVTKLMESIEPVFQICHRSTPRCISKLAGLRDQFKKKTL